MDPRHPLRQHPGTSQRPSYQVVPICFKFVTLAKLRLRKKTICEIHAAKFRTDGIKRVAENFERIVKSRVDASLATPLPETTNILFIMVHQWT